MKRSRRRYGNPIATIIVALVTIGWIVYLPLMIRDTTNHSKFVKIPVEGEPLHSSCTNELCIITIKGDKSGPNQDRAIVTSDKIILADGHGPDGHEVAHLVIKELAKRKGDNIRNDFLATDKVVMTQLKEQSQHSGSTVLALVRRGNTLSIASAGDSTAIVATYAPSFKTLGSAIKHKPADSLEKARIEKAGGEVLLPNPEIGDTTSRVVINVPQGQMALAMSRCMGDWEGKRKGYLLAEPGIVSVKLPKYAFAFIASDGVVDFHDVDKVLHRVGKALVQGNLPQVCQQILDESKRFWNDKTQGGYRDDMTLIVRVL